MNYLYKFDKDKCWYKDVCPLYDKGCRSGCVRYMKMHFLANNALLTEKQQYPVRLYVEEVDRQNYEKLNEIKKDIYNFVQQGQNLLIHSHITGNGKTQWAIKLMMAYFNKIWAEDDFTVRGLFISVPKLFNGLKESISDRREYIDHIRENILKADIVIWDELATKNLTDFEHSYLLTYINERLEAGKTNIFTSNLNKDELLTTLGDRVYSRIVNSSTVIELQGKDKRGVK